MPEEDLGVTFMGEKAVKQPWKSHQDMATVTKDRDRSSRYLAMI